MNTDAHLFQQQDAQGFEEKKIGVKGVGRKMTDESEHFTWRDGVKVPCGKLVPSRNKNGPLEYNEYAVYNPKQVRFALLRLVSSVVISWVAILNGHCCKLRCLVLQVSICFLVEVKYEEQNMEVVADEE